MAGAHPGIDHRCKPFRLPRPAALSRPCYGNFAVVPQLACLLTPWVSRNARRVRSIVLVERSGLESPMCRRVQWLFAACGTNHLLPDHTHLFRPVLRKHEQDPFPTINQRLRLPRLPISYTGRALTKMGAIWSPIHSKPCEGGHLPRPSIAALTVPTLIIPTTLLSISPSRSAETPDDADRSEAWLFVRRFLDAERRARISVPAGLTEDQTDPRCQWRTVDLQARRRCCVHLRQSEPPAASDNGFVWCETWSERGRSR